MIENEHAGCQHHHRAHHVLDEKDRHAEGAPETVVRDPAVVQSYLGAEAV